MNKKFITMSIEESPWIDKHSPEDVENYIKYFRGLATSVTDLLDDGDARNYGPFLSGAQQAVERYNITTRAHKMTKRTTFRFSELKDGDQPVTIFIIPDVSRLKAQKPLMELLQYCMFQEIKRHKNKHVLVHYIGDEANNQNIRNLDELMTWGRSYGLRFQLYIQNYIAFKKMYGSEALATLKSECEITLYLPNQREPETLASIEKTLGNQSIVAQGRNGNNETLHYRIGGYDYREDAQALMTGDEIRRTDKAILIIRRNKPMLVELPPIAAIHPFRDMIDVNPFHGKPWFLPIRLRLDRDTPLKFKSLRRIFTRIFKCKKRELNDRKVYFYKMSKRVQMVSKLVELWGLALIVAFFLSPIGPHLRTSSEYRQFDSNGPKYFTNCTYLGSRGFVSPNVSARCPLLIFIDSRNWSQ